MTGCLQNWQAGQAKAAGLEIIQQISVGQNLAISPGQIIDICTTASRHCQNGITTEDLR